MSYNSPTQIANTTAKLVLSDFSKRKFSFEKDMVQWLDEQSDAMRQEVETAAAKLREFKSSQNVPDVKLEYDSIESQIKSLQLGLAGVKAELKKYEIAWENMKNKLDSGVSAQDLAEVQTDDTYSEAKSEYIIVKEQIKTLLEKFHPDHPEIVNRQAKLNAAEKIMAVRAQAVIDDTFNNKELFEAKAKELEQLLSERENTLKQLEKDMDRYTALLNNLKEKEALYGSLMDKIKNEYKNVGLSVWQVDILDQAYLPVKKNKPPFWIIMFLALGTGTVATAIYNLFQRKQSWNKDKSDLVQNKRNSGMYIERTKEGS
jgi:uncharacterized protein involved in exopolysaccharide biosynthesis